MEIKILDKENNEEIKKLTEVLNRAFFNRSSYSSINPYTKITEEQLKQEIVKPDTWMYVMIDGDNILGSTCCCYEMKNGIKMGKISRVSVDPVYQGKGIAHKLLEFVHGKAQKDGCNLMELSVGCIWESAISLYTSLGYKQISIAAHIPGTYWLIKMMKPFPSYQYSERKRRCELFISKCKFKILFYKDSTPKILCKLIYRSR